MKGFTTSQEAGNRWLRAHHAAITRQCEEIAGKGQKVANRRVVTTDRTTRNKLDVENITSTISSMINPFDNDPEVGAGDLDDPGIITPPEVCSDLMLHSLLLAKNVCTDRLILTNRCKNRS